MVDSFDIKFKSIEMNILTWIYKDLESTNHYVSVIVNLYPLHKAIAKWVFIAKIMTVIGRFIKQVRTPCFINKKES